MPRADRLAPALPGVLGAVEVLLGVWMVSPHSFFDAIGPFQAYDPRYVRDVSTFSPAIGIAGAVALGVVAVVLGWTAAQLGERPAGGSSSPGRPV